MKIKKKFNRRLGVRGETDMDERQRETEIKAGRYIMDQHRYKTSIKEEMKRTKEKSFFL